MIGKLLKLKVKIKWLILSTLIATWVKHQPTLEVKVTGGWVRGSLGPGGAYHQFLGIPYAYTDHECRFKGPLPVRPWSGVFDAVDENVRCPQFSGTTAITGQEECLRLSVYRPLIIDKLLPVMVWIHGGGFFEGSSLPAIYSPDYIVRHDVIVVAMNYRLNIQGFLCLGTEEAPGNAGLKDQVAALRWVRDNIAAFGGDPNDVTLFGESAGSVSVSYHLLSPMSKGLFHRAILQSGSSLAPWAMQMNPVYTASALAKTMGFNTEDPHKLYKYFMDKTDEELILTRVPRPEGRICVDELLYVPCIEKEIPGVEPFLTDTPYNLLSRGEYNKVPVIAGFTSEEGLFFVTLENDTVITQLSFKKSMPKNLEFPNEDVNKEIAENFRRHYMGDEEISLNTTNKLSKLHGEPHFIVPTLHEIELLAATSGWPVFAYKFDHNGWMNIVKLWIGYGHEGGATHADDLFYLYKPRAFPTPMRYLESRMIDRMTTMWTNFAKYGDPTPEQTDLLPTRWSPVQKDSSQLLVINEDLRMEPLWFTETLLQWKQTYQKYRRKYLPWT